MSLSRYHSTQTLKRFLAHESASGLILMMVAALALICANTALTQGFYSFVTQHHIQLFVNDGLMALFFLLVGAELKREMVAGVLSNRARFIQPCCAAIGGMLVPSLIFLFINRDMPDYWRGWAIPAATDIAFALGVLSLLGSRIPKQIKVALAAIAILDDLGAIIIIALFYTVQLHLGYMLLAVAGVAGLYMLHRFYVSQIGPYLLAGMVIWIGFFLGGVHPTLAGVLTAIALPIKNRDGELQADAALYRVEHGLHPYVAFLIVPIFAFVNAGVSLQGMNLGSILHSLPLGIALGLLVGKPLGIMGGLYVAHATGLARKTVEESWSAYVVMAFLCGIGFTMALFIGGLAFSDAAIIAKVKLGILTGSALAGVTGVVLALCVLPRRQIKLT
jgi:NhaA family Na+:H+ antiporter